MEQKRIAILGSSGGNLYNQGGNNPQGMMKEIFTQVDAINGSVAYVQFIGTTGSMDGISESAQASLFTLDDNHELIQSDTKSLKEINKMALEVDEKLAELILAGKIDAIMLMSCDPKGVNHQALTAAAEKKIPIAGTGGTSMADTQALGCKIIAASGTTGTTNRTRAIAAVSAFSKEWGIKYSPIITSSNGATVQSGNVWKRINFRGIMMACMPAFIGMALCLALGKIPFLSPLSDVSTTLINILPVVIAAVAAKQISGMDEVGIVAGILAGTLAVDGGIIGGMVVGILAGVLVHYISLLCLKNRVPGTTANIAAGGLSGLISGLAGLYVIAPITLQLGEGIKTAIDWAITFNPILAGAVAGFAIWFAIMGGVYHAAILPIVLLEMEATGFSFLGAIDMCGLVMVCAGIQLANIIKPRNEGDRASSIPNLLINLGFGTFVEAAYPFMFSSKKIFAGAIAASTLSGIAVGLLNVKCTAYVPCFMSPLLSNDKIIETIICMLIAFGCALIFTLFANISDKKNKTK